MAKKNKLSTPAWILEGFDSEAAYNKKNGLEVKEKKKEKTFKVRECPKCKSDEVSVAITGEDCKGGECDWECRKCKWKGPDIVEKELNEDELMKYMDSKEEEVA
jgi:hypothetical protein